MCDHSDNQHKLNVKPSVQQTFKIKKCIIEPIPEPPPPDPCKLQKRRQLEKAGFKICPDPPIIQPPPPPPCIAICIEKIKNPPIEKVKKGREPIVCVVERQMTGMERCERIAALSAVAPVYPWPGCPPAPTIPPPPLPDPCEEQAKRQKIAECKERMRRYLE